MNNNEEMIAQIKMLCLSVTENNYNAVVQKGYELLVKLHDLGLEKKRVYQSLIQYYNSLEDNLARDCAADILDFVVGWCCPQKCIWKE